ncbi:arsenate reductase family protein, partial [Enterococcus faecalis]|nr:arsenate reductase family protein [Enterococcus faecalis]
MKELGADCEAIDITLDTPKADQIKSWIENSSFTIKNFFNTSGQAYRALGLKDKVDGLTVDEAAALLATDSMLIKRTVLIRD